MLKPAHARRAASNLLSRYCETMGELALRQWTEKAMEAARIETDRASRAKTSFIGTMSHELRTPLNAIIGFSDVIAQTSDGDAAQHAQEIAKAGKHMLGIVNDILDMSKLDSGTFQLSLDTYRVSELIEDTVPMVRQRILDKGQTLDLRLGPDLPSIELDMRRVRQILLNLLSNANKYTMEGGKITLAARRSASGGAIIAVADTGIGMTQDELDLAIRPFGQVQSHYTRTQEGSGLGLAIARGMARAHGGDLYLESEPGQGTCAVLTLPLNPRALAYANPPQPGGGERRAPRKTAYTKLEQNP